MGDLTIYWNYLNPVTGYRQLVRGTNYLWSSITPHSKEIVIPIQEPLWKLVNENSFIFRTTVLSGLSALFIKSYYLDTLYLPEDEKRKNSLNKGLYYHFIHTLAMLSLPLCRRPKTAAFFMICGHIFYCGTHYLHGIRDIKVYDQLPTIGEYCFAIGWIYMLL